MGSPGCARRTSVLTSQLVPFYFPTYGRNIWKQLPKLSYSQPHWPVLSSLQRLPHTQCRSHCTTCPECGDCQGGGGHVSLTDGFDMLIQMCSLSTNACAVTSCRCQGWALCFCTGGRSMFFHHVPFLILSKQT